MDPSIVKFLEDDEDESLHSGADVEAFSAALTRDIGGDPPSHDQQPPEHDVELSNQGSNNAAPQQLLEQWKTSSQDENIGQGNISVSKHVLEQWKVCTEDENRGQGLQQAEEQHLLPLNQHLSHTEQTKQELGVNENEQVTENHSDSSHPDLQEGHSQSEKQWNPPLTVERGELKTTEKVSLPSHKQERAQLSACQTHSSQQLNVQQSLPSNEESHPHSLQHLNVQQPQVPSEATSSARHMKQTSSIPFHLLIPILRPHLDKDRSMQLQAIFAKLRSNEVSKEDFLRVIRNIVGDQMLRQAAHQLQMQLQAPANRNPPTNPNLYSLQNQKGQKSPPQPLTAPASTIQRKTESSFPTLDNNIQKSREVDSMSDGKSMQFGQARSASLTAGNQERESSMTSLPPVNKLPQHAQIPHSSFSMYGSTHSNLLSHPYPRHSISAQVTGQKSQGQFSQTKQALHAQGITSNQLGSTQLMGLAHMPKYEIQSTGNESKRIHGASLASHTLMQQSPATIQAYSNKEQRGAVMSSMSLVKPEVIDQASEHLGRSQLTAPEGSSFGISDIEQNEHLSSRLGYSTPLTTVGNHVLGPTPINDGTTQNSSAAPLLVSGNATKTPQKKTSASHKKPMEAPGTSPPSSKKQKTSGAFHDQSIDQLNDVTAVSGVNLRDEEEQLLCAPKEESRASEASRKVVQEEEERLLLVRDSLQKKLTDITSKCGLKSIGSDVERCLSLCVEERLRGLVSYLIKLAKQRVDSEKERHRFVITSDVGQQILSINKKIKDDWDRKQGEEAEKLRKANEVDVRTGTEAEKEKDKDKEKDEARLKATKFVNKEEDDMMRTTAANVAARVAVGGDDMLSKWQLMAEQARQKREGLDVTSQPTKSASNKSLPGFKRPELEESEKRGSMMPPSGTRRKPARIQSGMPNIKVPHIISVKDVIAALEREPQMSKSSFLYGLYERKAGDSAALEQLGSL